MGWLERLKKTRKIKFRCLHGEAMGADNSEIRDELLRSNHIVPEYAHADVRNGDEFGLFYRQRPS